MSEDVGTERKTYRGERLAQLLQKIRRQELVSLGTDSMALLVSEIDRLVAENIRLRFEAQMREQDLLNAYAGLGREVSGASRDREEIERLMADRDKWRREADMAQAARNVALDKLVQIARIVSPDDFEEADA